MSGEFLLGAPRLGSWHKGSGPPPTTDAVETSPSDWVLLTGDCRSRPWQSPCPASARRSCVARQGGCGTESVAGQS